MLMTDSDTQVLRDERVHLERPRRPRTPRAPWTMLLRVAILAAGLAFAVTSGVALLRSIPLDSLSAPHVTAGWWHHTPGLALAHLAISILLLTVGSYRPTQAGLGTGGGIFLGGLTVVWGLITMIEPDALHQLLGIHTIHGASYVVIGSMLATYDVLTG